MYWRRTSDKTFPASSGFTLLTSAPRSEAASMWRSGHAWAVKRKTAGAVTMTDKPWGWESKNESKNLTIPENIFFLLVYRKPKFGTLINFVFLINKWNLSTNSQINDEVGWTHWTCRNWITYLYLQLMDGFDRNQAKHNL